MNWDGLDTMGQQIIVASSGDEFGKAHLDGAKDVVAQVSITQAGECLGNVTEGIRDYASPHCIATFGDGTILAVMDGKHGKELFNVSIREFVEVMEETKVGK